MQGTYRIQQKLDHHSKFINKCLLKGEKGKKMCSSPDTLINTLYSLSYSQMRGIKQRHPIVIGTDEGGDWLSSRKEWRRK